MADDRGGTSLLRVVGCTGGCWARPRTTPTAPRLTPAYLCRGGPHDHCRAPSARARPRHQLARRAEPADIADLGEQDQHGELADAGQGGEDGDPRVIRACWRIWASSRSMTACRTPMTARAPEITCAETAGRSKEAIQARPGPLQQPSGRPRPWSADQVGQGPGQPVRARHDQGVARPQVVPGRPQLGPVGVLDLAEPEAFTAVRRHARGTVAAWQAAAFSQAEGASIRTARHRVLP